MDRKLLLTLWAVFFFSGLSLASEERELYSAALENAGKGYSDFAFMNFSALLERYPGSKYSQDALFAAGEYYFLISAYEESRNALEKYRLDYPGSAPMPYVLMYLLKIARINQDEELSRQIEKEIISLKRLGFLFRSSRVFKFRSPLFKNHRAVYSIDKVEFYVDGELFARISY